MLQQTTVGTVLNHFERFLVTFPDIKSLAGASEEELLVAWKGLGYYRRARNLKKIAEAIEQEHGGKFPQDLEALQSIPGIGPYTANALVAVGMDRPALAVDANLERVLARFYGIKLFKGPALQKHILKLFKSAQILPDRTVSFRALNESLMDLGRTVCQARKASCELCPLRKGCHARQTGSPLSYPAEAALTKPSVEHRLVLLRVVVKKAGSVLVYQKSDGEWLSGQWELPTFVVSSSDKTFKQYPPLAKEIAVDDLPEVKTGITKYNIVNRVIVLKESEWKKWKFPRDTRWKKAQAESNLSTASLKCLAKA
jgi:A/G-specific adenine glycosylase